MPPPCMVMQVLLRRSASGHLLWELASLLRQMMHSTACTAQLGMPALHGGACKDLQPARSNACQKKRVRGGPLTLKNCWATCRGPLSQAAPFSAPATSKTSMAPEIPLMKGFTRLCALRYPAWNVGKRSDPRRRAPCACQRERERDPECSGPAPKAVPRPASPGQLHLIAEGRRIDGAGVRQQRGKHYMQRRHFKPAAFLHCGGHSLSEQAGPY